MATDSIDKIIHKQNGPSENGSSDSIRVMTVRLPAWLHTALGDEARNRGVSANKLAVAKLSILGPVLDKVVKAIAEDVSEPST